MAKVGTKKSYNNYAETQINTLPKLHQQILLPNSEWSRAALIKHLTFELGEAVFDFQKDHHKAPRSVHTKYSIYEAI
jgi:hypothetical protein